MNVLTYEGPLDHGRAWRARMMTVPSGWTTLTTCGCCDETSAEAAGRVQDMTLLRCTRCGTLRFAAIVSPDSVYRDGYHTGDSEFGWDYAGSSEGGYEATTAADRMAWIERFRGPGRLVDVGGGLGFLAAAAAGRGWDAELLEPVPAACEYARTHLGVRATEAGAEALDGRRGAYDIVSFVHCIEHIPQARQILRAAAGALRPDGLLFIEVPNHGSMARRLQGERWLGWQAGEHVYVFTRRSLLRLVDAAGYETVAVRTYVPGWEGLDTHGYAHMLGVEPLLAGAVRLKRRMTSLARRNDNGSAVPTALSTAPIREQQGARRVAFGVGFHVVARIEEALRVGTNLQVLAKPRP